MSDQTGAGPHRVESRDEWQDSQMHRYSLSYAGQHEIKSR